MRSKSLLFLVLLSLAIVGCKKNESTTSTKALYPITLQLDWVAEPEHGAFYTADALGYYAQEGLKVTIVQGGPNAYVLTKVATNQAQLGQEDSGNILTAIQSGAPILCVGSIFQHDPSALMVHDTSPITTWADFNGKTIMSNPSWAFLPFLRKKYGLEFKVLPMDFNLGRFAADKNFIQQAYFTSEPYYLEQKGIKTKSFKASDAGFDSYTVIMTNKQFAKEHPAELKAFLRATYKGWKTYIEEDPAPAHARMLKENPNVTPGFLTWCRQQMIDAHLAKDDKGDYISLSPERYKTQIAQLTELGILKKDSVKVEDSVTTEFLPKP